MPSIQETDQSENDLWALICSSQETSSVANRKARLVVHCAKTQHEGNIDAVVGHLLDATEALTLAVAASQTALQASLLLLMRERRLQAEQLAGFPPS